LIEEKHEKVEKEKPAAVKIAKPPVPDSDEVDR
jgi:hypothetical protein